MIHITKHLRDYLVVHRLWIAIFLIALFLDALSTVHYMHREYDAEFFLYTAEGIDIHPLVNWFTSFWGPVVGPFAAAGMKFIASIIVGLYWKKIARAEYIAASVIYLCAAFFNVFCQA